MYKEGHYGINALLYAPIAFIISAYRDPMIAIIGGVIVVGLAKAPDFDRHFDNNMDTHRSEVWQIIPIKHRGFTHTVWFAVFIGVLGAVGMAGLGVGYNVSLSVPLLFVFGFICGFSSVVGHLLGDVITPMGIKPFSPVSKQKYSLGICNASNTVANYGLLVVGGLLLVIAFGLGSSGTLTEIYNM